MSFDTKDVIDHFMRDYFNEYGKKDKFRRVNVVKEVEELSRALLRMAAELKEFIKKSYDSRFEELTKSISLKGRIQGALDTIANELFIDGITWCRIVTFLVYYAELARRSDGVECKIADWMCKYINSNLLQWIEEQGGWWSFKGEPVEGHKMSLSRFTSIAIIVLVGGLYVCSKLNGIKL